MHMVERNAGPDDAWGSQALVDALATPAFAFDLDGRYIAFNAAHEALLHRHYGVDIALGASLFDCDMFAVDSEGVRNSMAHVRAGEAATCTRWAGEGVGRQCFAIAYSPLRSASEVVGAIAVATDITSHTDDSTRATNEQLRHELAQREHAEAEIEEQVTGRFQRKVAKPREEQSDHDQSVAGSEAGSLR